MGKAKLTLFLIGILIWMVIPVSSAENEDFFPITTGMTLQFAYLFEHMDQKDRPWQVNVVKNSFPDSLTFTWNRLEKNGDEITGTRMLTDLNTSRNFNPWFKVNESKDTSDTAPWLSIQVLKDLQDNGKSEKFREGGSGAINWAPVNLTIKEKILFPVMINGKAEAIHALKLNKGITIWNNLKNPLVLEYKPLGIPLFTSISGWKLTAINN